MKRFILAAVAVSMLAVPTIQSAQAAPNNSQGQYNQQEWKKHGKHDSKRDWQKPGKHVVKKQPRWKHGQKYSGWKRHQQIRDYGRYGLKRPGHGQEWIRVGNDYVLVSIISGIIFGAIAAH